MELKFLIPFINVLGLDDIQEVEEEEDEYFEDEEEDKEEVNT